MLDNLKGHRREYSMEAAGLAGFFIIASAVTTLLDHPDLFVMRGELGNHPLLRMLAAAELFTLMKRYWLRGASWYKECPSYPIVEATPA